MRIGTWNLAGRWREPHRDLLLSQQCDVWLLTEVSHAFELDGFTVHTTTADMADRRHWAVVASADDLEPHPDPHAASAAAEVDGLTLVSSVLPWKAAGQPDFWGGTTHGSKMAATLKPLTHFLRDRTAVWGGDWNQALSGPEYAGSLVGRDQVAAALSHLRLDLPTRDLAHHLGGLATIDHIAVPAGTEARAHRVVAEAAGVRLSDHDMYVVEADLG